MFSFVHWHATIKNTQIRPGKKVNEHPQQGDAAACLKHILRPQHFTHSQNVYLCSICCFYSRYTSLFPSHLCTQTIASKASVYHVQSLNRRHGPFSCGLSSPPLLQSSVRARTTRFAPFDTRLRGVRILHRNSPNSPWLSLHP